MRYMAPWDAVQQRFVTGTSVATNFTPTTGHQCLLGLPTYQNSGCEHFGVWTAQNPTNAVYHWLIADPANPGSLMPLGTAASIPAPVYTIVPPPQLGGAPVVVAQIRAPRPPQPQLQFGDAQWVKVSKTDCRWKWAWMNWCLITPWCRRTPPRWKRRGNCSSTIRIIPTAADRS